MAEDEKIYLGSKDQITEIGDTDTFIIATNDGIRRMTKAQVMEKLGINQLTKELENDFSQLSEEKASINQLSLGIYTDGLMYIFINGQPIGMGIEVGSSEPVIPESLDKISVVDGIMTILSLTNKPTQSGSILTIS